jgi:hypothetical protein
MPPDRVAGRRNCGSSKVAAATFSICHSQQSLPVVRLRCQWHTRVGLERMRSQVLPLGRAELPSLTGAVTTARLAASRNLVIFWSTLTSAFRGGRVSVRLSDPLTAAVYPNAALGAAVYL